MVSLSDCPDMTIAVSHEHETTTHNNKDLNFWNCFEKKKNICLLTREIWYLIFNSLTVSFL